MDECRWRARTQCRRDTAQPSSAAAILVVVINAQSAQPSYIWNEYDYDTTVTTTLSLSPSLALLLLAPLFALAVPRPAPASEAFNRHNDCSHPADITLLWSSAMTFVARALLPATGAIAGRCAAAFFSPAALYSHQHSLLRTTSSIPSSVPAPSHLLATALSSAVRSYSSSHPSSAQFHSPSRSGRPTVSLNTLTDNPGAKRPVSTTHHSTHLARANPSHPLPAIQPQPYTSHPFTALCPLSLIALLLCRCRL